MGELVIRPYEAADHDAVWALHQLALNAVGAHPHVSGFDDDLHHIEEVYARANGAFLVGTVDGRIVAMGALRRISDERAEIMRMRVHPDFWRRGFGRKILLRLEDEARRLGCRTLFLGTTVGQTSAQKLYESCGYERTGRAELYGFEVIHYEKRI